jgi:hypothetical protein
MRIPRLALFALLTATPVAAQTSSTVTPPPFPSMANLSGPRIGLTMLSSGVVNRLQEDGVDIRPELSQFGWQFERQFYAKGGDIAVLHEWVVLLGGLEQGLAIPSLSWMVGLRTGRGVEFGVGPNITPVGVAMAYAAGITFNVPLNIAVVPSHDGVRVSMLTGFTLRKP